jgi:hypothetical protein
MENKQEFGLMNILAIGLILVITIFIITDTAKILNLKIPQLFELKIEK